MVVVNQRLLRICLPLLMLLLSAGACYLVEDMGELYMDHPAVGFTVHGDTEQSWGVKVVPGAQYEVTIAPYEPYAIAPIQLSVSPYRSHCPEQGCLASLNSVSSVQNATALTFTATNVHKVYVRVYWIADSGDLGTATIQIRKVTPHPAP